MGFYNAAINHTLSTGGLIKILPMSLKENTVKLHCHCGKMPYSMWLGMDFCCVMSLRFHISRDFSYGPTGYHYKDIVHPSSFILCLLKQKCMSIFYVFLHTFSPIGTNLVHCTQIATTVTTSQSNTASLICGGIEVSLHGCSSKVFNWVLASCIYWTGQWDA